MIYGGFKKKYYKSGNTDRGNREQQAQGYQGTRWQSRRNAGSGTTEYKKYRVRGHIRSFRDLEIYQQTTKLSGQIFALELPQNLKNRAKIEKELDLLHEISKHVPRLIAEAYGDKYTNDELAYQKLEEAMRSVSTTITKADFLIEVLEEQGSRGSKSRQAPAGKAASISAAVQQQLVKIIHSYQKQRRKILNLKRAWEKAAEKREVRS